MTIQATTTVNEAIRLHPETIVVFNELGVDGRSGDPRTLRAAASDAGVTWERLRDSLVGVIWEHE